jgi:2-methylcitrate dehydratase PrpD
LFTNRLEEFVGFVDQFQFKDLPPEVVNRVKLLTLNLFGCIVGAYPCYYSNILMDFIKGFEAKEESTILVDGAKTNTPEAAWINGAMAETLEFEDTGMGNLGPAVIPAALAMLEKVGGSGEDLITCAALGWETGCRISSTFSGSRKAVVTTPISSTVFLGTYAATISAGKAAGLDSTQLLNALGMCSLGPFAPYQVYQSGTITNSLKGGWPAKVGSTVTQLAKRGFTGTKDLLYGEMGHLRVMSSSFNMNRLTEDLGKEWKMLNIRIKSHAACGHNQAPLDVLLEIIEKNNIKPKDVGKVTYWVPELAYMNIQLRGPLMDEVGAQRSLPYQTAVVLKKRRRVLPEDSCVKEIRNAELVKLSEKVELYPLIGNSPDKGVLELRLKSGRVYHREFYNYQTKGDFRYDPFTPAELQSKFRNLSEDVLGPKKANAVIEKVDTLEGLEDVAELVRVLVNRRTE